MAHQYFKNEFQEDNGVLILDRDDKYVANFGKQWRDHVNIQIDSKNNFSCSQELLENVIFSKLDFFNDKTVLEIGCGAGRFSEHIVKHAKDLVLVDLSQAIFFNVAQSEQNCKRVKADFLKQIILGDSVVEEISSTYAFELLSHMKGGPSIKVLLDLLFDSDQAIALESSKVLKTQVFLYESDLQRLEKAFKEGSAIAKDLLESYANAEFFTKLPELPETIELVTMKARFAKITPTGTPA